MKAVEKCNCAHFFIEYSLLGCNSCNWDSIENVLIRWLQKSVHRHFLEPTRILETCANIHGRSEIWRVLLSKFQLCFWKIIEGRQQHLGPNTGEVGRNLKCENEAGITHLQAEIIHQLIINVHIYIHVCIHTGYSKNNYCLEHD